MESRSPRPWPGALPSFIRLAHRNEGDSVTRGSRYDTINENFVLKERQRDDAQHLADLEPRVLGRDDVAKVVRGAEKAAQQPGKHRHHNHAHQLGDLHAASRTQTHKTHKHKHTQDTHEHTDARTSTNTDKHPPWRSDICMQRTTRTQTNTTMRARASSKKLKSTATTPDKQI